MDKTSLYVTSKALYKTFCFKALRGSEDGTWNPSAPNLIMNCVQYIINPVSLKYTFIHAYCTCINGFPGKNQTGYAADYQ